MEEGREKPLVEGSTEAIGHTVGLVSEDRDDLKGHRPAPPSACHRGPPERRSPIRYIVKGEASFAARTPEGAAAPRTLALASPRAGACV